MFANPRSAHALLAGALLLTACSSGEEAEPSAPETSATSDIAPATPAAPDVSDPAAGPRTLRLEGLGDLVIGEPIPSGSNFAVRGAQIPGTDCETASSPEYPGVHAMTIAGEVRRISVGDGSDVTLIEGIGPGDSEDEVLEVFPTFRETPHTYVEAPAKYLTQPGDDPRLRFEIDAEGNVSAIHVGLMPQLGYVEGCA